MSVMKEPGKGLTKIQRGLLMNYLKKATISERFAAWNYINNINHCQGIGPWVYMEKKNDKFKYK